MQWQKINKYSQYFIHIDSTKNNRATIWVVHIICDAIELNLHACSRVIYTCRSLSQATVIHPHVGSIGWGEVFLN